MKARIWLNRILFSFYLFLSFLATAGRIAFGHGIGDLIYCIILWIMTITLAVLLFVFGKNKPSQMPLAVTIVFACILFFLIYSMTFGRGTEYRWNGNVFYLN